jgi:hypothetical protein
VGTMDLRKRMVNKQEGEWNKKKKKKACEP